ncbi:hypothetical protein Tco_1407361 [Tanacetum coccineum]
MYLTSRLTRQSAAECYCARYHARTMKNTQIAFSDADLRLRDTRKSTTEGIQLPRLHKMEMVMPHFAEGRISITTVLLNSTRHSISIKIHDHESSRIKDKDFRTNLIYKDLSFKDIKSIKGELASFQDDAKYVQCGSQDTRSKVAMMIKTEG